MIIVRAAIMFSNGEVVEGHEYGSIVSMANKLSIQGDRIYGFTTGTGEFVLPNEAAEIAVKAKQIEKVDDVLKPEDLWPQYVME